MLQEGARLASLVCIFGVHNSYALINSTLTLFLTKYNKALGSLSTTHSYLQVQSLWWPLSVLQTVFWYCFCFCSGTVSGTVILFHDAELRIPIGWSLSPTVLFARSRAV